MLCFNSQKVGYIKKTHGTKGEVIAEFDFAFPKTFKLNKWVFLQYQGTLIPFSVEWYEIIDEKTLILKFLDYDQLNTIQPFVLCPLHVEKSLAWLKKIAPIYQNLQGYKLYNQQQYLGLITETIPIKGNPLIQVENNNQLTLFPFQENYIKEINHNKKIVIIELP